MFVIQNNTMAKSKKETKRDAPTPVRIPEELKAKAKKQAEKEDRSLSNLIIRALKQYLK